MPLHTGEQWKPQAVVTAPQRPPPRAPCIRVLPADRRVAPAPIPPPRPALPRAPPHPPAPRDSASMPTAPVPAYRSSHRDPAGSPPPAAAPPERERSMLKTAARDGRGRGNNRVGKDGKGQGEPERREEGTRWRGLQGGVGVGWWKCVCVWGGGGREYTARLLWERPRPRQLLSQQAGEARWEVPGGAVRPGPQPRPLLLPSGLYKLKDSPFVAAALCE